MSRQYSISSNPLCFNNEVFSGSFSVIYHNLIAFSIIECQIFQAQVIQVTQIIEELSLFQTHTHTTKSLLYETTQLSLKSELVQVFTD